MQAVSRGMDTHREDSCLRDSWEAECISDPYTTHFIVNTETCDIPSTYIPLLSSLLRRSKCRNTNSYSRNRHVGDSCLGVSLETECLSDSYNYKIKVKHDTREIPPSSHCPSSEKKQMYSSSRNRHTHACWRLLPRSLFGGRMSVRFLQLRSNMTHARFH